MAYQLYESIEALIAPETLATFVKQPVTEVHCKPMAGGFSGGMLFQVTAEGQERQHFVLKRMSRRFDWAMRATHDVNCRAVALCQHGLLDRLPEFVDHTVLACAQDGDGWALLMYDISAWLMPPQPWAEEVVKSLIEALAAIHATFWGSQILTDPAVGLCDVDTMIQQYSPQSPDRFPSDTSSMPEMLREGWQIAAAWLDPDVAAVLAELQDDSQPILRALGRFPTTLIHGNYRDANLGFQHKPDRRVYVLDWQHAGYGLATIDVAWFLTKVRRSIDLDMAADHYQLCLGRRLGDRIHPVHWQPMWDLGMLVDVLRMAPFYAWFSVHHKAEADRAYDRQMLENYNDLVRTALQWL